MNKFIVSEAQGGRLDRWLTQQVAGRPRNQIQHDIKAGLVRVDGEVKPARYQVCPGNRIEYDQPEPAPFRLQPEATSLLIAYEDEHLIVIDKPAGQVVHPAPGHAGGTIANALLAHCGPALEGVGGEEGRWGIVHRLDQWTSGLMMAAKTQPAYEALVEALSQRRVRHQYLGLVIGSFKEDAGNVDRPIGRRLSDRKRMGIARQGEGREARTDWRLLCQGGSLALLGLSLQTGRTHQIRVHLQSIGHPVLGDPDYGWSKPRTLQEMTQRLRPVMAAVWPARQMLHAALLTFEHPVIPERRLRFASAVPGDMIKVMNAVWNESWNPPLENWYQLNDE